MFYGTGSDEIASGAHGDISIGCSDFVITQNIHEVKFYVDANNNYVGAALTYDPPATAPAVPIEIGSIGVSTDSVAVKTFDLVAS